MYIFALFSHLNLFGCTGWCVWELFYAFKNTKSDYFVWWGDCTFFFRYFIFIYFSKQPKQNHNLEYYQETNYYLYSRYTLPHILLYHLAENRLDILHKCIHIFWYLLTGSSWMWFSESDLNFSICLDLHAFISHCIIDVNIHISQPHITVV